MPAILAQLGGIVGKVFLGMAMSLLTEAVLKRVAILVLAKIVAKTENKMDDEILAIAKEAWEK